MLTINQYFVSDGYGWIVGNASERGEARGYLESIVNTDDLTSIDDWQYAMNDDNWEHAPGFKLVKLNGKATF